MKTVFEGQSGPEDENDLRRAFELVFEELTGNRLQDAPEMIKVTWTRRENGGMSNGLISRDF